MRKFKKLLSFAIAAVMAIGIVTPAAAFTVASDVAGTKYEEAAATLGALGIMIGDENGDFRPDADVSRAEFAKIAVHALGLESVAETSKGVSNFPDVATDHWANGYINVAASQKLIIGDENGRFNPESTISYQDAVTILIRVLGHEPAALSKGGYPTGFLVQGEAIGITKKVSGAAESATSRGTTALMTFNSLTINLMEQVGFGNDVTYEVVDKTLLEDKLDVEKGTGIITGNALTRLDGNSSLRDDEVEIGAGNIFKVGDSKADQLLGYNVTYYVKEEDNKDKTLVLVQPEANKNQTLEIQAKDLAEELTEDTTVISYYPEEDAKAVEAELADDFKVIYNQKAAASLKNPETGSIKLLDTDRDEKYDVVFINEHVNYVVDEVSTVSNKIYDKYEQEALDLDTKTNKDLKVQIQDTEGNAMELNEIKEWDVLSVYKNTNYVKIIVSREYIDGKVTETSATEENKRVIDGVEYEVAHNIPAVDIELDMEGRFYLDMEGKIAGYDAASRKSANYAFMLNAAISNDFDAILSVKIFDEKGESKIIKAADKIRIDDETGLTAEKALEKLKGGEDKVTAQMINYELNAEGQITMIDTASDKTANFPQSFVKEEFAKNFEGQKLVYKEASKKLNIVDEHGKVTGSIGVAADTIVFDIPQDETDTDNMAVRNRDMFTDGSEYDVEVYDLTETLTARAIRVTSSTNVSKIESPIAVVEKITRTNNEDNINVDKLYALVDGKQEIIMTESIETLKKSDGNKLEAGDIIQYSTNSKGEIEKFTLLFEVSKKDQEEVKEYGNDNEMVTVYGKVYKKFSDSINVSVAGGPTSNYSTEGAVVYKYDSSKTSNKVSVVTAGEITRWEDGSNEVRVFLRIYKDEVKEIVIVK